MHVVRCLPIVTATLPASFCKISKLEKSACSKCLQSRMALHQRLAFRSPERHVCHQAYGFCTHHMTVSACFSLSSSTSFSDSKRATVTLLILFCPNLTAAATACVLEKTKFQEQVAGANPHCNAKQLSLPALLLLYLL